MKTAKSVADALHKAHVALMKDVDALEKAGCGDKAPAPEELVKTLTALRTHVTQHFRFEEQDGYLDAVSKRMPQKEKVVQQLLADHRQLAADLEDLIAAARHARAIDEAYCGRLQKWAADLRKHETQENLLVEDAFCQDIGNKD